MDLKLNIKHFLSIAFFLIAMTDADMLYAQNSCTQNNIVATNYQLRNEFGESFSVTDGYELGDPVSGELWVILGGNSTSGYNLRMFYDFYSNGSLVSANQQDCLFSGTTILHSVWIKARDITWSWGDVIEVKNIFIDWTTGTAKPSTTCNFDLSKDPQKTSQCYRNLTGFTAAVPLFPKFDFTSNGICNTNIQFTNQTIGGTPPYSYSYSWDFDNDNISDSNLANPTYNFPSTGIYPINLTVFDGTSTTTITKNISIDPNFGILVDIFPTKNKEESGIIYVRNVTGGTAPYSYSWTGPNGFTSTDKDIFNLIDGLYQLTVTDANGCSQTEQYVMEIATVLSLEWKSFELILNEDKIKVIWEMNSDDIGAEYVIQRGDGNISTFQSIATIRCQNSSLNVVKYEFEDPKYSRFEEKIYYRIQRKHGGNIDYSPVKMIKQENQPPLDTWMVFPNPSSDGVFNLKLENSNPSNEQTVMLDVYNTGNLFKKASLSVNSGQTVKLDELFGTLPTGIIFLKIQTSEHTEIFKLINKN
jgi:PKD repeat protein